MIHSAAEREQWCSWNRLTPEQRAAREDELDRRQAERSIQRLDRPTLRLQAVVREVFRHDPALDDDEQWSPDGTCDSTCALLDEDGLIYEAFPGAELVMWGREQIPMWDSGHCYFRLPDGTIIDPTVWQFTKEDRDWYGAVYRFVHATMRTEN